MFKKGDIVVYKESNYNKAWENKPFKFFSYTEVTAYAYVHLMEVTDGYPVGYLASIAVEGLYLVIKKESHFPKWW